MWVWLDATDYRALGSQAASAMLFFSNVVFGASHPYTRTITEPSVYPRALDDAQTALTAFGQYEVRATPMQMAMVSAARVVLALMEASAAIAEAEADA